MRYYFQALAKCLSYRTGVLRQTFFNVYPYMFTPNQLMFLAETYRSARDIPGCCLEVGCAYGATTVFLKKLMAEEGVQKDYIAMDTFSGFVPEQADFEIKSRRKRPGLKKEFSLNKREWFEVSLRMAGAGDVRALIADAAKFDYASLGPIAFCLLDVDLYIPTREALPKIYKQLSPGGVMIIDDCKPGGDWDGALQAYQEYCADRKIPVDIHCDKLGVLRKPN